MHARLCHHLRPEQIIIKIKLKFGLRTLNTRGRGCQKRNKNNVVPWPLHELQRFPNAIVLHRMSLF